jgi:hypothetical protein
MSDYERLKRGYLKQCDKASIKVSRPEAVPKDRRATARAVQV